MYAFYSFYFVHSVNILLTLHPTFFFFLKKKTTELPKVLNLMNPSIQLTTIAANSNGSLTFDGTQGVRITNFARVTTNRFSFFSRFSLTVPGSGGYIFAKGTVSGSRYYSLFVDTDNNVLMYYRVTGSTVTRFVTFNAPINDGLIHEVLMVVQGQTVTVTVDGVSRGSLALNGPVDDCGDSDAADCLMFLGQRGDPTGGRFYYNGLIYEARLFYDQAL